MAVAEKNLKNLPEGAISHFIGINATGRGRRHSYDLFVAGIKDSPKFTVRVDYATAVYSASFRDDGTGNMGWYIGAPNAADNAQIKALSVNKTDGRLSLILRPNWQGGLVPWDSGNFDPANYLPIIGGTLSGNLRIQGNWPNLTLRKAATDQGNQLIAVSHDNLNRWSLTLGNSYAAEDFDIEAYNNAGGYAGILARFRRADLKVYFSQVPEFGIWTPWHSGNFNPSNYALLSGASFSGDVNISHSSPGLYFNETGLSGGQLGKWRWVAEGNTFRIDRSTSVDWTTPDVGLISFDATNKATFSTRPTWQGFTPWDSGNFNPANYLPLTGGTIQTGSGQFTSALSIASSTHATSERAAIFVGNWGLIQDSNGDGVRNFNVYNSIISQTAFDIHPTTNQTKFVVRPTWGAGAVPWDNANINPVSKDGDIITGQLQLRNNNPILFKPTSGTTVGLEFGTNNVTNYIYWDFHTGTATVDYDGRLAVSGAIGDGSCELDFIFPKVRSQGDFSVRKGSPAISLYDVNSGLNNKHSRIITDSNKTYVQLLNDNLSFKSTIFDWDNVTGKVTFAVPPDGVSTSSFPAGTKMLFAQTSAPTGWTKDTTHNDKALRVVTGTASSGGNHAFSTVFARTATDGYALTDANLGRTTAAVRNDALNVTVTAPSGVPTNHAHDIDIRVQYVDVIIATKS